MTDDEIARFLRTETTKEMAAAGRSEEVLKVDVSILDDIKPIDSETAKRLNRVCESACAQFKLPTPDVAFGGYLVVDGNHFTTLIKSVLFEPTFSDKRKSEWYKTMLDGFMRADRNKVELRGEKGKKAMTEEEAKAKLDEWARNWDNFGGVDVHGCAEGEYHSAEVVVATWEGGLSGRVHDDANGDDGGAGEKAEVQVGEKWTADQKNFMQRWLLWCEDPLKRGEDGKPVIVQDVKARQEFLDARPKEKRHELATFTSHRELTSFQYFDSLINAPMMSMEAPES
eukprot:jgi/Mesvir1/6961/Mv09108-RA.1